MFMKNPIQIFKELGAIITDTHVVYASGKHGNAYINKDAVYPHTKEISYLCKLLADKFLDKGIEVVAGPTVGGVILSQWVAHYLDAKAVFAEGDNECFFKRGYDKLVTGKKVLVVEDVLTTGGSAKKVVDAVRKLGGDVIACGALVNRGGVTEKDIGAPLVTLIDIRLDVWEEKDCPLCKRGVPINIEVGKGREYLKSKNSC